MDYWYTLNLGDAMLAVAPSEEVEQLFMKAFLAAGRPSAMAVFTRHESEGRLHCEVIAYFSPASGSVAEALGAAPCPKPARADLGLLAGSPDAWAMLFPESHE